MKATPSLLCVIELTNAICRANFVNLWYPLHRCSALSIRLNFKYGWRVNSFYRVFSAPNDFATICLCFSIALASHDRRLPLSA